MLRGVVSSTIAVHLTRCKVRSLQGQKKEARQYVKRLLQMGSGSGILTAAVILLGRGWLPQLFSPDPNVIAAAARALPVVALFMVLPLALAPHQRLLTRCMDQACQIDEAAHLRTPLQYKTEIP